jgi:hypothetical protein
MNRISPLFAKDEVKMDSISVRPATASVVPIIQNNPKTNNFKLFNKIPINRRETHVNRSNSITSKGLRFLQSDSYTTYDTKWSKTVLLCACINMAMFLIFIVFYFIDVKKSKSNLYVKEELITEEFKKNNSELDNLNTVNTINSFITGIVGTISILATAGQFYYVYSRNDFRN